MSDIMKFIVNAEAAETDHEGNLIDLEEWSEERARSTARVEGIELTPAHLEVVGFLRQYYRDHGKVASARKLSEVLETRYRAKGGRRYLYRLFPKGPVNQASRIAGLPVPQHSVDPSFGSSQ
jgi:tRNA 2-thiouridine synthesizing protein E